MQTPNFGRRQFCQLTAAGLGGLLLPNLSIAADAKAKKAPKAKKPAAKKDAASGAGVPEIYGDPLPFVPGSYSIAVLPDTQHYSERFHQHYLNQTAWIADNAKKHNIKFVLHLGDITNHNTLPEWEVAQKSMRQLDGKVPYAMVTGNHDFIGSENTVEERHCRHFNTYFPHSEYKKRSNYGGALDEGGMDNTYHTFNVGNQDYIVIGLEWAPRDQAVEWADKIVAAHPKHRAILITHAYMYHDNTRYDYEKYKNDQRWTPHGSALSKLPGSVNDGEQLWKKLVSKHPNFLMTLNGHVLFDGLGRLTSRGAGGQNVHQMLVNYQMKKEGGESAMRLIEFLPDDETLQVKAYVPSIDKYKVDPENQFILKRTAVA